MKGSKHTASCYSLVTQCSFESNSDKVDYYRG